jgi:hypothetical protein
MPKPSDWTPLIPHALQQLRAMRSKVVDRAALQQLLRIHRRTAIRLMHQLGGEQAGKTFFVDRERLISELEAFLPSGSSDYPPRMASQVRRLHAEAEGFRFPDVRASERRTIDQLPTTIQIASGKLTLETGSLQDLCAQLWILLETCKDDRDAFEERLMISTDASNRASSQ